jgi:hypothetical protein
MLNLSQIFTPISNKYRIVKEDFGLTTNVYKDWYIFGIRIASFHVQSNI